MNPKEDYNYAQRLSEAISWLRFPFIFLIILLHCYSVVKLDGSRIIYFKVIYPFALWLGETGVPGFLFISGYLFYFSKKKYGQKLKSRFYTLFIPYLLWNSLFVIAYIIAYAAGYPQIINFKSITNYNLFDYIRLYWDRGAFDNGNFVPALCPFWYIRNLLILSILSPLLLLIIRYVREIFIIIVTIWWITTYHNALIPQTILFFSLGAYFSILNINPLEWITNNKIFIFSLFAIFALSDIAMHTIYSTTTNLQIHRLALIFNIPVFFLLADFCIKRGCSSILLPKAAFIVFAVHYPIVVILRKFCASQFATVSDITHIVLYFTCVIIATLVSLLFYLFLDKYFVNVKNILSGNR